MKENNMPIIETEEIKTNSGKDINLSNLQSHMLEAAFGTTIDYSLSPLAGEEFTPGIE